MKDMNYELIHRCSEYAAIAHKGQFRKDKITPYIIHPARVASLISMSCNNNDVAICSAWLHDVLEDCVDVQSPHKNYILNHKNTFKNFLNSLKDICSEYKINQIEKSVTYLTMSQDESISKDKRREKCYFLLKTESDVSTVIIKCCDRIDNITTAHNFSQGGFKWYLIDTLNLIKNLGDIAINEDLGIYKMLFESFIFAKTKYFEKYGKDFDSD